MTTATKLTQKERELALTRKFLEQVAAKAEPDDKPMTANRAYYLVQEALGKK